MAKAVKKRPATKTTPAPPNRRKKILKATAQIQTRSSTKQSRAIEMLRSQNGANIDALMKATGWQKHSVRGFLAGVVRKRLKLNLDSTIVEGVRVYRVIGNASKRAVEASARCGNA